MSRSERIKICFLVNRIMKAIPASVSLFLLLSTFGCLQSEVLCSTNTDCPSGMFCVDGRCSSLECRDQGSSCDSVWECCGSLECVNGICESFPELDHKVKISLHQGETAQVYGSSVRVSRIDSVFDSECKVLGESAEIEFGVSGQVTKKELRPGDELNIKGSSIRIERILGDSGSSQRCALSSKYAVVEASRTVLFNSYVFPGLETRIPGSGMSVRLLNVTGANVPDGQIPCRFDRTATLELISENDNATIQVSSTGTTVIGDSIFQIDSESQERCMGPEPMLTISLAQKEEVRLVEGQEHTLVGNMIIKLDRLDMVIGGDPCAVKNASAVILFWNTENTADFGSVTLKPGAPEAFGTTEFRLKDAVGEFTESSGACIRENPGVLIDFESPTGAGGLFINRVPEQTVILIEYETIREETPLTDACVGQNMMYSQYVFDEKKRSLDLNGVELSPTTRAAYGIIRRVSGNSFGLSRTLLTSDTIPFDKNGIRLLGVNKAGDATLTHGDATLVLGVGESAFSETGTYETIGDCALRVRTSERMTNQGFVRVS